MRKGAISPFPRPKNVNGVHCVVERPTCVDVFVAHACMHRAGYSVFIEIPIGAGKLIMLPQFKDRAKASTIIVNEIIPQIIHEEEVTYVPKWFPSLHAMHFSARASNVHLNVRAIKYGKKKIWIWKILCIKNRC